MTTLFYMDPELVIGLNREIISVNPNDLQIFKSVSLPEVLPKIDGADEKQTDDTKGKQEQQQKTTAIKEPLRVQNVCLSPNFQLLAVATSGQKALLIYRCRPEHAWLVSTRSLARTSSALCFASDSESVLVTDKTGDCYFYDCVNLEAMPRLLFGHLSIVYDLLWTADKKHIITCDRDDKIRVTNYPDTHDIHGYCLGHKEFVAGLAIISDHTIVSVSGDKTLRLWNYDSCNELAKIELPGPATCFDIRKIAAHNYEAAVLHPLEDCVSLYDLKRNDNGDWDIKEVQVHKLSDIVACNLCFADNRLYVAGVANEKFELRLVPIAAAPPPPENWLNMVNETFQKDAWTPEDITTWFKKRYDNVTEYLERKKRRIEEKRN